MANTKTSTQVLASAKHTIQYFTLVCVGNAQETNTIIYNASATLFTLGVPFNATSRINSIKWSSNSSAGLVTLNWDATTPVVAWSLPLGGRSSHQCFREFGGLPNQGGTGITGNITLTTTGLATGDTLSLVLDVLSY
jgi:hypothetical protein